jgi:L-ascorbate metabolism protein UlaG (beta-lactamase superfamily)
LIRNFNFFVVSMFIIVLGLLIVGCSSVASNPGDEVKMPAPPTSSTPSASASISNPTYPATTPPTISSSPTPTLKPSSPAPVSQLQWLGQSAFLLTSSRGTRILIDPSNASTGYVVPPIDGVDAVLVSHEHADHNNVSLATGNPIVLRGLTAAGWNPIDQVVKDTHIITVSPLIPIFHDNQEGAQRGRNSISIIEVDGLRLVHLGDLGHVLTADALKAIGRVDIVLVPVGGVYTIDANVASQIVSQLNPRIAVPMHYKTPRMQANWPGSGVEAFLQGMIVERPNSSRINISSTTLPAQPTVVVLNYE